MCGIGQGYLPTGPAMRLGNAVPGDPAFKGPRHLLPLGSHIPCAPSTKVAGYLDATGP
jgi:hypothetical protein